MTIEELNKLIQEELKAYLNEEQTDEAYHEDGDGEEGDDDIEVTTDEPAVDSGDEAMETLRQIYDMLKPVVEPEEEPEMDMEEPAEDEGEGEDEDEGEVEEMDENMDHPNYRADYVKDVAHNAEKIKGGLNESFDAADRFKKLANIKG